MTTTVNDQEIEIKYASATTAGFGQKKIVVEIERNGNIKEFKATTSNMPDYDAAMDIEDIEEKYFALYEIIAYRIQDQITEWLS